MKNKINIWITSIYKKGLNKVIFFNNIIKGLELHTDIEKDNKIECYLIQDSKPFIDYTVRSI